MLFRSRLQGLVNNLQQIQGQGSSAGSSRAGKCKKTFAFNCSDAQRGTCNFTHSDPALIECKRSNLCSLPDCYFKHPAGIKRQLHFYKKGKLVKKHQSFSSNPKIQNLNPKMLNVYPSGENKSNDCKLEIKNDNVSQRTYKEALTYNIETKNFFNPINDLFELGPRGQVNQGNDVAQAAPVQAPGSQQQGPTPPMSLQKPMSGAQKSSSSTADSAQQQQGGSSQLSQKEARQETQDHQSPSGSGSKSKRRSKEGSKSKSKKRSHKKKITLREESKIGRAHV